MQKPPRSVLHDQSSPTEELFICNCIKPGGNAGFNALPTYKIYLSFGKALDTSFLFQTKGRTTTDHYFTPLPIGTPRPIIRNNSYLGLFELIGMLTRSLGRLPGRPKVRPQPLHLGGFLLDLIQKETEKERVQLEIGFTFR